MKFLGGRTKWGDTALIAVSYKGIKIRVELNSCMYIHLCILQGLKADKLSSLYHLDEKRPHFIRMRGTYRF